MKLKKYLGETTFYEKKREVERNKVKNWLKTVSAFANGKGGILIFGVSDDDEIIGLEDYKKDSEFISEKIKTLIEPVPNIEIKYLDDNNKNLLLVRVFSGNQTPYYYIGNGSRQAFVRIGNESVITRNHELTRLDVEILLNVKKSRARDLITYLLKNNFISKIGKYKSTKYIKNQS